jgi:hypothetical protein
VHSALKPWSGFGAQVPPQQPWVAMSQPDPEGRQHAPRTHAPSQQSLSALQETPVTASGMQHFFEGVHVPVQQSSSASHATAAPTQHPPAVHGPEQQSSSKVHCPIFATHAHFMSTPHAWEQQSPGMAQEFPTVAQQGGSLPAESE